MASKGIHHRGFTFEANLERKALVKGGSMSSQASQGWNPAKVSSTKKAPSGKSPAEAKEALARVRAEVKAREGVERKLSACKEENERLEAELSKAKNRCSQLEQELEKVRQNLLEKTEPIEQPHTEPEELQPEEILETGVPAEPEQTTGFSPPEQPTQLIIQDIQVFHANRKDHPLIQEKPHRMVGRFQSNEDITIQTSFLIQGRGATQITTEEYPFEIDVYAHDADSIKATRLEPHQARLTKDKFTYTIAQPIPSLLPGIYNLRVYVKIDRMLEQRKGPTILIE